MIASTSKACRVQRRRITCRFQIPLRDKTATVSFAKDSVRVHIPGESMDVVLREHQRACETVAVRLVKMAVEALRARSRDPKAMQAVIEAAILAEKTAARGLR